MDESKTPRTDAVQDDQQSNLPYKWPDTRLVDFARQLERELNAALDALNAICAPHNDKAMKAWPEHSAIIAQARQREETDLKRALSLYPDRLEHHEAHAKEIREGKRKP